VKLRKLCITLTITLIVSLTAWQSYAAAAEYRGDTYPVLTATKTGIIWSSHVQGFRKNTAITYHYVIYRDHNLFYSQQKSGFHTDSHGFHWRLPPNDILTSLDCGPGLYQLYMWVSNRVDSWRTQTGYGILVR
jgi:hypothetical protein